MTRNKEHFLTTAFVSAVITLGGCNGNPATDQADPSGDSSGQESVGESDSSGYPADTTSAVDEADKETMTTGQGKTMTLTLQSLRGSRGYLYCELVFNYGDEGSDIYSTSPLAEAKLDWWDNLDLESLAKAFGAESVYKNGPQWWSMDEVGVMASEPVNRYRKEVEELLRAYRLCNIRSNQHGWKIRGDRIGRRWNGGSVGSDGQEAPHVSRKSKARRRIEPFFERRPQSRRQASRYGSMGQHGNALGRSYWKEAA